MLTHNDAASISSCVAFIHLLWELLRMGLPPDPLWWLDTFRSILLQVETSETYELRSPALGQFRGALSQLLDRELTTACHKVEPIRNASERWYSGAYVLETVPCALYILMRHAHDPEEAMVRAANDTFDNDTTAAILGAAVGALYGAGA